MLHGGNSVIQRAAFHPANSKFGNRAFRSKEDIMKKILLLIVLALIGFYALWPAYSGYQIHSALQAGDRNALANKIDFQSVRHSMRTPVLAKIDERMSGFMKSLGPAAASLGIKQVPKQKIEAIVDGALAEVVEPGRIVAIYGKGGDFAGAMQESVVKQIDKLGGVGELLGLAKATGGGTTDGAPAGAGDSGSGAGGLGGLGLGGIKVPGGLGGLLSGGGGTPAIPGLPAGIPGAGELIGKLGLDTGKLAKALFPKPATGAPASGSTGSSFGLGNIKSFGFNGPLGLQMGVARSAAAPGPEVTAGIEFRNFDWKVTKLEPNL